MTKIKILLSSIFLALSVHEYSLSMEGLNDDDTSQMNADGLDAYLLSLPAPEVDNSGSEAYAQAAEMFIQNNLESGHLHEGFQNMPALIGLPGSSLKKKFLIVCLKLVSILGDPTLRAGMSDMIKVRLLTICQKLISIVQTAGHVLKAEIVNFDFKAICLKTLDSLSQAGSMLKAAPEDLIRVMSCTAIVLRALLQKASNSCTIS